MIDQFSKELGRYSQGTGGTAMLTIRAIDIRNADQQDVLEVYIGSESKKAVCLKVKPLPAFEDHAWITPDLIAKVIACMQNTKDDRVLQDRAHQLASGLNDHAPKWWTVRVVKTRSTKQ